MPTLANVVCESHPGCEHTAYLVAFQTKSETSVRQVTERPPRHGHKHVQTSSVGKRACCHTGGEGLGAHRGGRTIVDVWRWVSGNACQGCFEGFVATFMQSAANRQQLNVICCAATPACRSLEPTRRKRRENPKVREDSQTSSYGEKSRTEHYKRPWQSHCQRLPI